MPLFVSKTTIIISIQAVHRPLRITYEPHFQRGLRIVNLTSDIEVILNNNFYTVYNFSPKNYACSGCETCIGNGFVYVEFY